MWITTLRDRCLSVALSTPHTKARHGTAQRGLRNREQVCPPPPRTFVPADLAQSFIQQLLKQQQQQQLSHRSPRRAAMFSCRAAWQRCGPLARRAAYRLPRNGEFHQAADRPNNTTQTTEYYTMYVFERGLSLWLVLSTLCPHVDFSAWLHSQVWTWQWLPLLCEGQEDFWLTSVWKALVVHSRPSYTYVIRLTVHFELSSQRNVYCVYQPFGGFHNDTGQTLARPLSRY